MEANSFPPKIKYFHPKKDAFYPPPTPKKNFFLDIFIWCKIQFLFEGEKNPASNILINL